MWEQCIAIILPEITLEFNPKYPNLLGIGQQVGLIIGASVWSLSSDVIGRRLAFNVTLAIASIFGTASAGAPNFAGLNTLLAFAGIGIGGNRRPPFASSSLSLQLLTSKTSSPGRRLNLY
jgi:MFS family permease